MAGSHWGVKSKIKNLNATKVVFFDVDSEFTLYYGPEINIQGGDPFLSLGPKVSFRNFLTKNNNQKNTEYFF